MPNQFQKSLQDYLSKIKKPSNHLHFPSRSLSSSTSWILRGCKHPKTPSFAADRSPESLHHADVDPDAEAATLSDIDRFLFENFKSLYQAELNKEDRDTEKSGEVKFDSPKFVTPPTGLQRFFVSAGSSGSLMDEFRSNSTDTTSDDAGSSSASASPNNEQKRIVRRDREDRKDESGGDDFIALLTYSPSPYNDFRNSMQEMIDARLQNQGKVNWEFMEELLFRYLNLNEKKAYRHILSAFVDLVVVLRENGGRAPARSPDVSAGDERRK